MFSRQVAHLALVWLGGIAGWAFSGTIRVQVSTSGSAIQSGDRKLVDVVHCRDDVSRRLSHSITMTKYSLKGPPLSGNPEMEICTFAPVPFEFELMTTAPRTVVSFLSGNLAEYCVPIGLLYTTGALLDGTLRTRPRWRKRSAVLSDTVSLAGAEFNGVLPNEVPSNEEPSEESPTVVPPSRLPLLEDTPAEVPPSEVSPSEVPSTGEPSEGSPLVVLPSVLLPSVLLPSMDPSREVPPSEVSPTEAPPSETPADAVGGVSTEEVPDKSEEEVSEPSSEVDWVVSSEDDVAELSVADPSSATGAQVELSSELEVSVVSGVAEPSSVETSDEVSSCAKAKRDKRPNTTAKSRKRKRMIGNGRCYELWRGKSVTSLVY